MPTRALTVVSVARIKAPKQGQVDYFDRGYPGLALRVSYGGAKAWIYFYRLHGKLRRLSLGRFPGMSLEEARNAWRAARLAVSKGESPAHVRPTTADTFGATVEEWIKRDQAKNRSIDQVRQALEYNALPVWRDRLIAGITRRDVLELIDGVTDRGALTMARRLHSHLHRLFRWAVGRGILEVNPMADLPKPGAAVKRDRVLNEHELGAVSKAAEKTAWPFGPAVRLLILTAARREEIGALRWSEIHGDEIHIPAERSKTKETRTIPLSPAALALIQGLQHVGEHVFSANGSGLGGWSKAKRAIDATAAETNGGPLTPWRLHDLRRTVATNLQRLGIGLQVIEAVLGHVSGSRAGIVGVYQRHQFDAEKRDALEQWAREIERIAGGKKAAPAPEASAPERKGKEHRVTIGITTGQIVRLVDPQWVMAVRDADSSRSLDPIVAFLKPGVQLGAAECALLNTLLERMQYRQKEPGQRAPLGQKPREEVHEWGARYVRRLQEVEGLDSKQAINKIVEEYPEHFKADEGLSLTNFMKRGGKKKRRSGK